MIFCYACIVDYLTFKAELKQAGLSIRAFAHLLDIQPASVTNYRSKGYVPRHLEVIARLLRALHDAGHPYTSIFGHDKATPVDADTPKAE